LPPPGQRIISRADLRISHARVAASFAVGRQRFAVSTWQPARAQPPQVKGPATDLQPLMLAIMRFVMAAHTRADVAHPAPLMHVAWRK